MYLNNSCSLKEVVSETFVHSVKNQLHNVYTRQWKRFIFTECATFSLIRILISNYNISNTAFKYYTLSEHTSIIVFNLI